MGHDGAKLAAGTDADIHDRYEELMSRACDGECTREEERELLAHLAGCDRCRGVLRDLVAIDTAIAAHRTRELTVEPPVLRQPRRPRIWLERIVAVAVCAAIFFLGQLVGHRDAVRTMTEKMSSVLVTTPSMWNSNSPLASRASATSSERPFTDGIRRYRSEVADELRNVDVDWSRIRSLLEAMGELRTDLELLTAHLAYMEISTGRSPADVAALWERLGNFEMNGPRSAGR